VLTMNTSQTPAAQVWLNGTLQTATLTAGSGSPTSDASNPLILGNNSAGARSFQGRLDEWRVSRVARSADWITTSYASQQSPATFYSVSSQQTTQSMP
jgi:hypothetical protein